MDQKYLNDVDDENGDDDDDDGCDDGATSLDTLRKHLLPDILLVCCSTSRNITDRVLVFCTVRFELVFRSYAKCINQFLVLCL